MNLDLLQVIIDILEREYPYLHSVRAEKSSIYDDLAYEFIFDRDHRKSWVRLTVSKEVAPTSARIVFEQIMKLEGAHRNEEITWRD